MRLGVIGADTIGTFIGSWASKIGYEVLFPSKHLLKETTDAQMVAEELELIFLATDFEEGKKFLNEARLLMRGKNLVDVTHPHFRESAEEFAKIAPETNIVKIFKSLVETKGFFAQDPSKTLQKIGPKSGLRLLIDGFRFGWVHAQHYTAFFVASTELARAR